VCLEHVAAATAALISRATGGRGYGRAGSDLQIARRALALADRPLGRGLPRSRAALKA
jgi:hypothetical protein